MNILIISSNPWNNDNSFGNSFSNIFDGVKNIRIANIYCRTGVQKNSIVEKSFQITERMLIENIFNRKKIVGRDVTYDKLLSEDREEDFNQIKKFRFIIFFWVRELLWKLGAWENHELKKFIDDFQPDLIFSPIYYSTYMADVENFVKKYTKKPMMGYISDDNYSLRQFSLSPLYWLNRFIIRPKIKLIVDQCDILYVISEIQKKEYEKCFHRECKILYKGLDFSQKPENGKCEEKNIVKMLYAGNIGGGRWKTLGYIGTAIEKINQSVKKIELDIYTPTPLTHRMKNALKADGIHLHQAVSNEQIQLIQNQADILVHVESFSLKERLTVHQSFSTKIVDYLGRAKCIFAAGSGDCASIACLLQHNAAAVATNRKQIYEKLEQLIRQQGLRKQYGDQAWRYGQQYHQITEIQDMLYKDIKRLCQEREKVAK